MIVVVRHLWTVALMTRPLQILLVLIVAALGIAVARARGADIEAMSLIAGLVVLIPVAASIHLVNEYADHATDARTARTPFSGGSGALMASSMSRDVALRAAGASALVGLVAALSATWEGILAPQSLVILGMGLVGGWAYSVGPWPLAWNGLGEVVNAALGGMLLPLYGVSIAGGDVDPFAVAAFGPLMLVVVANLLATTWPDRVADAAVGKRTLATRWPANRLRRAYAAVAGAASMLLVISIVGPLPVWVALAGLTALPFLVWGHHAYTRRESPLPTVVAMSWLIGAQLVAWLAIA